MAKAVHTSQRVGNFTWDAYDGSSHSIDIAPGRRSTEIGFIDARR